MNKIYRLAEKHRDIGKKVYCCDEFCDKTIENSLHRGSEYRLNSVQDYLDGTFFKVGNNEGARRDFKFAFVEVTPADFSDEELTSYLVNRGITFLGGKDNLGKYYYWGIKDPSRYKEKTLADFSDDELANEFNKRAKSSTVNFSNIAERFYSSGYATGKKETLENVDLLINTIISKGYSSLWSQDGKQYHWLPLKPGLNHEKLLKESYEAGKRDAEPKWVKFTDAFPPEDEVVLLKYTNSPGPLSNSMSAYTLGMYKLIDGFIYNTAIFENDTRYLVDSTAWLKIHAESQPEQKPEEPKHICAQCGKSLWVSENPPTMQCYGNGQLDFCNKQCAEDYEWIAAELPRDYGKPCRSKNTCGNTWIYNYILRGGCKTPNQTNYLVELPNKYSILMTECQVRRDSVGEK